MYRQIFSILAVAATINADKHQIKVGNKGQLKFDPAEITAAVGDTLEFRFYNPSGPHNVVSGDFSSPCAPGANAFFSGDMTGDADGNSVFVVEVTSTDPIYFYCSEGRHCQNGMVGAVNAPASAGFAAYKAAAQKVAQASEPAAVTGGTVSTKSSDDSGGDDNSTSGGSSTASGNGSSSAGSQASTTGAGSSASSAASATSAAGGASQTSGAGAGSATTSRAPSSTANIAGGRTSEGTVLGGLAALLGGFVALMA